MASGIGRQIRAGTATSSASPPVGHRQDPRADGGCRVVDVGPVRDDGPGDLTAGYERQCRLDLISPLDLEDVRELEPAGVDGEKDLTGARLRVRYRTQFQDLRRVADLGHLPGTHRAMMTGRRA